MIDFCAGAQPIDIMEMRTKPITAKQNALFMSVSSFWMLTVKSLFLFLIDRQDLAHFKNEKRCP
jgi:hypothetical protein